MLRTLGLADGVSWVGISYKLRGIFEARHPHMFRKDVTPAIAMKCNPATRVESSALVIEVA